MTTIVGLERALMLAVALALLALGGLLAYVVQWSRDAWKEHRERKVVRDIIRNHKPRAILSRQQRRAQARTVAKQFANYTFGGKVEGGE